MIFFVQNRQLALSLEELRRLCNVVESLGPSGKAIIHLNEWSEVESPRNQLYELAQYVPSNVTLQLNKFDWRSRSLNRMREIFPNNRFILPYNSQATDEIDCLSLIQRNLHVIDDLLIDESEGNGELCDVARVATMVSKFRTAFPTLSLGVAGGLGTGSAAHVAPHLRSLAPINVDAETGFWKNGELLTEKVADYLRAMFVVDSLKCGALVLAIIHSVSKLFRS
jgi:hypothetical protein